MQNIRKQLDKYEAMEATAQGERKAKLREEIKRLQRIILFLTRPSSPVRESQIEYSTSFNF